MEKSTRSCCLCRSLWNPQPQLPVLGQLGVGHPSSGESIESILVKLRPRSAPPPVLRSVLSEPNLNHLLQQQQQHQHAMSPSPSLPFPHVPCYGDYVPLLVNVRKLQHDDRLKALIDANELELNYYPDYFANNQVEGGYPFTASTANQGPPASTANQGATPPPGGEEGGGEGDGIYQDITLPASPKKDLFVFHVPNHMTEEQLHNLFSHIGQVRRARIQYDMNDNSPKGYGFVTFKRLSDAVVAVHSLNGFQFGDKFLAVTYCRDDSRRHTNRPGSPNSSSTNNGISTLRKEDSARNRKARRGLRRTSA